MPAASDPERSVIPATNVDSVVTNLWAGTLDLDGEGLVRLLRLLSARAEQIKAMNVRAAALFNEGGQVPEQLEANGALLEIAYEATCLRWFLACAFKRLAEGLEYDVYERQNHLRRMESVIYNAEGDVESFKLGREERDDRSS
jgi:hypothetical protein